MRGRLRLVLGWLKDTDRGPRDIVEVGCGSGWLCELMTEFGRVHGIDLSDEVLARSRVRFPKAAFTAGDFMQMELPVASADVVVALEVLSHIGDQPAFMSRVARLLRGDGVLMLATQNRFVLERTAGVTPPATGQVRQWVDAAELRRLLEPHFEILQLTSLHPTGHLGVLRWINSGKLESLLSSIGLGDAWTSLRERWSLGHTLMVQARKRDLRRRWQGALAAGHQPQTQGKPGEADTLDPGHLLPPGESGDRASEQTEGSAASRRRLQWCK